MGCRGGRSDRRHWPFDDPPAPPSSPPPFDFVIFSFSGPFEEGAGEFEAVSEHFPNPKSAKSQKNQGGFSGGEVDGQGTQGSVDTPPPFPHCVGPGGKLGLPRFPAPLGGVHGTIGGVLAPQVAEDAEDEGGTGPWVGVIGLLTSDS